MAEHAGYEVWQMGAAVKLIRTGSFPTVDGDDIQKAIGNALLESALVHLRSLDDFFGRATSDRDDDVLAIDFLPTWVPERILSTQQREDINKYLAHLTTKRARKPLKWQLDLMGDAQQAFRDFLTELKASWPLRFAWFKVELT